MTTGDPMAEIQLRNLTKRWGDFVGVADFNLDIPDKEFLVLLGPSGCGKTTTSRMRFTRTWMFTRTFGFR